MLNCTYILFKSNQSNRRVYNFKGKLLYSQYFYIDYFSIYLKKSNWISTFYVIRLISYFIVSKYELVIFVSIWNIYLYLIERMKNPYYKNEFKSNSKQIGIQFFFFNSL